MKPIIIVPTKTLSPENLKMLRDNELCVIEAKDPAKIKFLDPIPSASQHDKAEAAAISLSRILLNGQWAEYDSSAQIGRSTFSRIFVDLLIKGTALDRNGTIAQQRDNEYNYAYAQEVAKLAREDARNERAKKKKEAEEKAKQSQSLKSDPEVSKG